MLYSHADLYTIRLYIVLILNLYSETKLDKENRPRGCMVHYSKCKEGKKCVYDEEKDEVKCVCQTNSDCTGEDHRVCATDDVSYPSLCHMHVAACASPSKKIKYKSEGHCPGELYVKKN